MMARHCEGCGLKMTPYLPRTRSASGESLLCVECHQLDGWGHHASRGVPIRHFAHQPIEGDDTLFHCPWCFSGDTRYMTRDGHRTFAETVGTKQFVLTGDPNDRRSGRWVEADIREFGEQELLRVTMTRSGVTKVVEATAEHRWLVKANRKVRDSAKRVSRKGKPRDWRPSECLRGHPFSDENTIVKANGTRHCRECSRMSKPVGGLSRSTDRDVLTKDLKPGMRLSHLVAAGVGDLEPSDDGIRHGIVFGDGSRQGKWAYVNLWGDKDKQLIRYFPGRTLTPIKSDDYSPIGTGVAGVRVTGDLWSHQKELPSLAESDEYLFGFLAGYLAADGTVEADGSVSLSSSVKDNLEFVRGIAARLGITTYAISEKVRLGLGKEPSSIYSVTFARSTMSDSAFLIEEHRDRFTFGKPVHEKLSWTVKSVEATGKVEKVYCAVVPDTHTFALEDNVWVGNCGSGQIIARSDGTVQCNFCSRVFTVSLQPEHAEMPQTVDGQAVVPLEDESPEDELADASKIGDAETVGEGLDTAEELAEEPDEPDVVEESTDDDPGVTPRDTDSEDEESEDDEEESENPFTKKKSYLVLGGALDEDAFVRHLAMKHTTDPGRTLRALRRSRR